MSNDIEDVINQLFKLLRRNLVEDPTDPSENQIIVDLFLVLGKCFSSSRGGNPSLLKGKYRLYSVLKMRMGTITRISYLLIGAG